MNDNRYRPVNILWGHEPRFPAWGACAARRCSCPFGRFQICCSRGGAGAVFPWPASPRPATKNESAQPTARTPRRGVPTFGAANGTRKRVENPDFSKNGRKIAKIGISRPFWAFFLGFGVPKQPQNRRFSRKTGGAEVLSCVPAHFLFPA